MTEAQHLRASLAVTAIFLALGIWLEAMFGLRAAGELDDPVRREFLRLGHAHGALLGMLNVVIDVAMRRLQTPPGWARRVRLAGLGGAIAVGIGFVGGGLGATPHGPGPMVFAVPAGAIALLVALLVVVVVQPDDRT